MTTTTDRIDTRTTLRNFLEGGFERTRVVQVHRLQSVLGSAGGGATFLAAALSGGFVPEIGANAPPAMTTPGLKCVDVEIRSIGESAFFDLVITYETPLPIDDPIIPPEGPGLPALSITGTLSTEQTNEDRLGVQITTELGTDVEPHVVDVLRPRPTLRASRVYINSQVSVSDFVGLIGTVNDAVWPTTADAIGYQLAAGKWLCVGGGVRGVIDQNTFLGELEFVGIPEGTKKWEATAIHHDEDGIVIENPMGNSIKQVDIYEPADFTSVNLL